MDRKFFDELCNDLWEDLENAQKKHPLFCKKILDIEGTFAKTHYERCAEVFKEANDSTPPEEIRGESIINEELMEMFTEIASRNYRGAYLEGLDVAVTVFRALEWIQQKIKGKKCQHV